MNFWDNYCVYLILMPIVGKFSCQAFSAKESSVFSLTTVAIRISCLIKHFVCRLNLIYLAFFSF